jgi:hypothetical protein
MTNERLTQILTALHWGERTLAVALGTHWTTVRRWRADPAKIPPEVERWLERIAEPLLDHPLPEGWTRHAEHKTGDR